jgi:hypothetical protein
MRFRLLDKVNHLLLGAAQTVVRVLAQDIKRVRDILEHSSYNDVGDRLRPFDVLGAPIHHEKEPLASHTGEQMVDLRK